MFGLLSPAMAVEKLSQEVEGIDKSLREYVRFILA